jgi:hypothetical protein
MSERAPRKQTAKNSGKPMQKWKEVAESYLKQEDGSEDRLAKLDAEEQAEALLYLVKRLSQKRSLDPHDASSLRERLPNAPRGLDIVIGVAVLGGGSDAEAKVFISSGVTESIPCSLLDSVSKSVPSLKRPALLQVLAREVATGPSRAVALMLVTEWLKAGHANEWPKMVGGTPELHSILIDGLRDQLLEENALPFWKAYTNSIPPASLDASPEWRNFLVSLESSQGASLRVKQMVSAFLREGREAREARTLPATEQTEAPSGSTSQAVGRVPEVTPAPVGAGAPVHEHPQPSALPVPGAEASTRPIRPSPGEAESKTEREERTAPPSKESVEDRAGYGQRLRAGKSSLEKLASLLDESEEVHQQLKETRKQLEEARRKNREGDAERESLEGQVAEQKRRTELQEELARVASQRAATFEASLRHERSEVARFRDLLAACEADLARLQERSNAHSAEVDRLRTLLNQRETQLEEARREAAEVRADRDRIAVHHDENIDAERRLTRESVLAEFRGRIENILKFEFEEAERFASSEDEKESLQRLGKALSDMTRSS